MLFVSTVLADEKWFLKNSYLKGQIFPEIYQNRST